MKPDHDDSDSTTAAATPRRRSPDPSDGWGKTQPYDPRRSATATAFESDEHRRYEVLELLGRGGMGEVHLAHDERVGRAVALKVLLDERPENAELRERFVREARIQGQLEHPGIVPVYDIEPDSNGRPFFAMKRVTGETLDAIVRKLVQGDPDAVQTYTLRRLLAAFQQICLTVHYAHTRGVIHRDLKLGNLMLGGFGEVYVLDWGIAKVRNVDEPRLGMPAAQLPSVAATRHDYVLGTLGYIPPEQIEDSSQVDARADVYALGVVLFTLLTRRRLHAGRSPRELIESTHRGADARASLIAPELDVPPELDAICVRATAPRREDRYATARELHDAIERFLEGDRDVRLRAELAEQHLAMARRAIGGRSSTASASAEARRDALRQAGRALALQPENVEAGELLASMMLTSPDDVPDEVLRASSELGEKEQLRLGRIGLFVVLGVVGLLSLLLWVGVRSWGAVAWICVPLLVAVGILVRAQDMRVDEGPYFAVSTGVALCVAIGASATILGSLWLPALFATTYAAVIMATHGLGRWRILCVALALLAILVPFGLELGGILPMHYRMEDDHLVVLADAVSYPERSFVSIALAAVSNVLLVSFALFQFSKGDMRTRRELQLMAWHLRQVAPLRDSRRPPPDPAPPSDEHDTSRDPLDDLDSMSTRADRPRGD